MGTVDVEKANVTIMRAVKCLNAFIGIKVRLRRNKSKAKKGKKIKKMSVKKIYIFQNGRNTFFLQLKNIKNQMQLRTRYRGCRPFAPETL